ncbi:MAG: inositol monophosphatase family protein [Planctomycetota bacterium]
MQNPIDLDSVLDVAKLAAQRAGEVLLRYQREGFKAESKSDTGTTLSYNLVTAADVDSERVVGDTISDAFPHHALLGEENLDGDVNASDLWIIDPLDGTNNYVHGVPHYAVSIGYYRDGLPMVGVVYCPATNQWFTAVKGRGATHNDQRVYVAKENSLSQVLVGCGFYYDRGEMMRRTLRTIEALFARDIHGIRRFGTASLDLCYVGCGLLGAFFEYQLSPWDFAAGRLFVEEAGGKVTNCDGSPLTMEKTSVLASNRHLHAEMLAVIAQSQTND